MSARRLSSSERTRSVLHERRPHGLSLVTATRAVAVGSGQTQDGRSATWSERANPRGMHRRPTVLNTDAPPCGAIVCRQSDILAVPIGFNASRPHTSKSSAFARLVNAQLLYLKEINMDERTSAHKAFAARPAPWSPERGRKESQGSRDCR